MRARPSLHDGRPLLVPLLAALALHVACSGGGSGGGGAAGIVTSAAALQTVEGGPRVSFTVRLGLAPAEETGLVLVTVTSLDTTEGNVTTSPAGYGYSYTTLWFTALDWDTPQTVYVVPYDETASDGDVTYTINVAVDDDLTLDPTYLQVPDVAISVTNADNDVPGFTLSRAAAATTESGTTTGSESFTVVLNTPPSAAVTIPVQSLDVTEGKLVVGSGTSCTSAQASVSLSFSTSSWSTAQTVKACGQQDLVDDGNVTYAVQVGPPSGAAEYAALPAKTVSVTNSDDDTAGLTVTAGTTPLVTSESGTTATFTVRLNTAPQEDVVVPVRSANVAEGVLSSGAQNAMETVNLTFTPSTWSDAQTVTVTGQDEVSTQVPGDHVTYDVTVGPPMGDPVYAASVGVHTVAVTNLDDDAPAFVLSPPPGSSLTVGESGVTTATFSVRVNRAPSANVVIPVSASDVTEALVRGGSSPSVAQQNINLTFTQADWQTAQTVTVVGQVDATVDGTQLSTVTVGKPTSADPGFDALTATSLAVTTVDADSAGFTVSRTSVSHDEGGTASFTVVLNKRPTAANVTVPVASGNTAEGLLSTSAAGPFGATIALTFTNADALTPQTVYVKGVADDVDDGNQGYTITVGPTSSADARWALASRSVSATNVDVNTAGLVVTPTSGLVTTEGGGTASFTVKLASKPTQTVMVPVAVPAASSAEARVSSGGGTPAASTTLYFTGDNWGTPQPVTVTGQDDAALDGNRPFTVTVGTITSGDAKYNGLSSTVDGRNDDDETGRSEGTAPDPVNLDSALPYAGQVGPGSISTPAHSYYSLWRAAGSVAIVLTAPSAAVTLTLDDDGNYASGTLCTTTVAAFAWGSCAATLASAARIHIRVTTTAAGGAGFTLDAVATSTWTSSDVPRPISDYSDTYSNLTVAAGPTSISRVTVKLSITHTYNYDLDIYLVAPDGTSVTLSTDNSGYGYTETVFDDAAATPITLGTPPYTGSYRPEGLLSALNGKSANGTWRLRIYDDAGGDVGSLTAWSITIP